MFPKKKLFVKDLMNFLEKGIERIDEVLNRLHKEPSHSSISTVSGGLFTTTVAPGSSEYTGVASSGYYYITASSQALGQAGQALGQTMGGIE